MLGFTPVTDEQLARHLGLEHWHVGSRQLTVGTAKSCVWVNYLWRFDADPSFHPCWTLAGMCADAEGEGVGRFRRGVWVRDQDAVVADLESDPVVAALNEIRLVETESPAMMTLDGISYRAVVQTHFLEGEMRFSNPDVAYLVWLERAAFGLCRHLGRAARRRSLAECLVLWRSYAEENLAEPGAAADRGT
jgi:hypothetical protein